MSILNPENSNRLSFSCLIFILRVQTWCVSNKAFERSTSGTNHRSQLVELSITCAPALNTSPHRSSPSHSPLNTDFTPLHSKIAPLTKTERKKERSKEMEKESPPHLASSCGVHLLPVGRLPHSLINPTFVFEVIAFKLHVMPQSPQRFRAPQPNTNSMRSAVWKFCVERVEEKRYVEHHACLQR